MTFLGSASRIIHAKEAVWGSAANLHASNPNRRVMGILNQGMELADMSRELRTYRSFGAGREYFVVKAGHHERRASFSFVPADMQFLYYVFGESTDAGSVGAYTHSLQPVNLHKLPSLSMGVIMDQADVDGSGRTFMRIFTGGIMDTCQFSLSESGELTAQIDLLFKGMEEGTAEHLAASTELFTAKDPSGHPWMFYDRPTGAGSLPGTARKSRSISATTTNSSTTLTAATGYKFISGDLGKNVSGTGIPSNTMITAIATDGGSATMSAAATASATVTVTVGVSSLQATIQVAGRTLARVTGFSCGIRNNMKQHYFLKSGTDSYTPGITVTSNATGTVTASGGGFATMVRAGASIKVGSDSATYTVTGCKSTSLTATATDSATTLTVASTTGFPSAGTVIVDDEVITYTGTTATTFTGCTRAASLSVATPHANGSVVYSDNVITVTPTTGSATGAVTVVGNTTAQDPGLFTPSYPDFDLSITLVPDRSAGAEGVYDLLEGESPFVVTIPFQRTVNGVTEQLVFTFVNCLFRTAPHAIPQDGEEISVNASIQPGAMYVNVLDTIRSYTV